MAATLPAEALALLDRHLGTRWGGWQAEAHLHTWSAEAILVAGPLAQSRQKLGDEALMEAWAKVLPEPPYRLAPKPDALLEAGEGRYLVRLAASARVPDEAPEESPGGLWLGLIPEGDGYAVAFSGFASQVPSSWDEALFFALAELSSLGAVSAMGPFASLADAGWARRAWLPKQRLLALPETRFACQGLGHCCEDTLTIGLDDAAATFLAKAPLAQLMPDLGPGPYMEALPSTAASLAGATHKLLRREDNTCRFLDAKRRCMLHAQAGRALFKPCHVFPFRFAWTPDGVAVTTLASCPTARKGFGPPLAAVEKDVRARLQVAELTRPEGFWLGPAQEIPWAEWRTVEGQVLEILNQEAAPLKARLAAAIWWLAKRSQDPEAALDPTWLARPPKRLGFFKRWALSRYVKMFNRCFTELHAQEKGLMRWEDAEADLAHFYRSLLFSKRYTYPFGLQAGLHAVALSHRLLEVQAQKFGPNQLSEAFWREAYGVLTIGTFPRLLQVVHRTPATGFANMLGQPGFALGMLCL